MKRILLLSGIILSLAALAIETGPANTVFRVPSAGGRPKYGAVNLASSAAVTGALPVANGGTGQTSSTNSFDSLAPTTTKGDLIVHNGTDNIRVAVGSNDQVLVADSAQASGVKWAANPIAMFQSILPFSGAATGDTTPVTGTAPNWTWTAPVGVSRALVCGRGGGGGGGGGSVSAAGCGGGGSATACFPILVTPSTGYAVTIGGGGAGGAVNTTGTDGSSSTFSSLAIFQGGQAGGGAAAFATTIEAYINFGVGAGLGGHGGTWMTSVDCTAGARSAYAAGGPSGTGGGHVGGGGGGGDSVGGTGGIFDTVTPPTAGTNGSGGGGGYGGAAQSAGAAGGNGQAVVIWTK